MPKDATMKQGGRMERGKGEVFIISMLVIGIFLPTV